MDSGSVSSGAPMNSNSAIFLMGLFVAMMLCLICACTSFVCGAGIGYIIRNFTKQKDMTHPQNKPPYRRVAGDESEQVN